MKQLDDKAWSCLRCTLFY